MMKLIHSETELLQILLEEQHVKLMGAGKVAEGVLLFQETYHVNVIDTILVSDAAKNPKEVRGVSVCEIADADGIDKDALILLAAVQRHWPLMVETLRAHGYQRLVVLDDAVLDHLLGRKRELQFDATHTHRLLRFEVQLAEHCNLNCCGCTHFAPLAKQELLDVEEYRRDCARLSELFHGEMEWVHLMGGEPLLHPDVAEIAKITRKAFPYGRIMLVTNGVLLPKMEDAFWTACHDCRIEIWPTKYPIDVDYDAMAQKAVAFDVIYRYYGGERVVKTLFRQPLNLTGDQSIEKNWYHCEWANQCLTLRHGKIYACTTPAHVHHLARYFHLDFPLAREDSIDIYQTVSGEELLEACTKPLPFCRFCNLHHVTDGHAFTCSKKEMSEWVDA